MAREELLKLDLQRFAEGEGNAADGEAGNDSADAVSEDNSQGRIAELEKQLAEAERRNAKLKSTMDVKLKELGDLTKKERERMTAEERERKEIEEIKAQNELLLKEQKIVNVEKRFIQMGCDADLANEGARVLIDADYDGLFEVFGRIVDSRIAGEKSELLKAMPKPQGSTSSQTMTQEQFDNLNYKQRVELYEKDPETYNKFK